MKQDTVQNNSIYPMRRLVVILLFSFFILTTGDCGYFHFEFVQNQENVMS